MSGAASSADLDEAPARTIYLNQPQQSKFRDNWVRYGAIPACPLPGGSMHTPQPWAGRALAPLPASCPCPDLVSTQRVLPLPRQRGSWARAGAGVRAAVPGRGSEEGSSSSEG